MDFKEMAEKLGKHLSIQAYHYDTMDSDAIEDALRAAYNQGIEDAAKVADFYVPLRDSSVEISRDIRALTPPSEK